jgi:CRP-like cAMP-binding protein
VDGKTQLRSIAIFANCSDAQINEIDHVADEVHVEAGRTIIQQGDLGQEFVLLVDGEAEVVKDGVTVATLGPGGYFGEVALLESVTRTASVVAKTDVSLQVIDRRGFNTLLDDLPALNRAILHGLASRLAELEEELHDLRVQNADS